MIRRIFDRCLVRPEDLRASQDDLEVIGTFNPGAIALEDGRVALLVRVAERPKERRLGYTGLPRWGLETGRVVIDWMKDNEVAPIDVRVVRLRRDNLVRLNFISHLRVLYSDDGRGVSAAEGPRFEPGTIYEEFGVEDPRLTRIGDIYYLTYVAVSRHGVATALASTRDFRTFERHGIIFHPENKDVLLFPERIGGSYYALHRPNAATPFTKPEMWIAASPDLLHWGRHERFLGGGGSWEVGRIGGGTPPWRTPDGWLEIYHGNSKREEDSGIGAYSAGALLLDLNEPRRIIGRSPQLFIPEKPFETEGFVPNVVFPTGIVPGGETVLVYYGAADTYTAVVEFLMAELMGSIQRA